ncbi:MAG: DUF2911 domain-containing protein [Saprospiraceae bacterium]|nr:DUF2911 domain-containing protein [Saprospiraceae bacterium]
MLGKLFSDPKFVAYPFIFIPLLGQIVLLIALFQKAVDKKLNGQYLLFVRQKKGNLEINVHWNAPGVKGREGKIWGTDIAYFGTTVLGFGSDVPSPWRAGADECTTMSFSTDVTINGQMLKAGKYAFFIELGKDESTLIFNSNIHAWGTYFMTFLKMS